MLHRQASEHTQSGQDTKDSQGTQDNTAALPDNTMAVIEHLLRSVVEALVEEKSLVQVDSHTDETTTTLTLKVAPRDIGRVLGRQGRTATSLRTILQSAGIKYQRRLKLDITEIEQVPAQDMPASEL
jgi:predicted RNA-binding protein YlqC (UPF0109 family)